jgi:molybdopterin-guanine dinucleotide biosynthesis protein A
MEKERLKPGSFATIVRMERTALTMKFCQGFVLAGGMSSRFGQDKALMRVKSQTLAEIVAYNMADAVDTVTLVGSREKYESLGLPVIEDQYPGLGPLSGIHAALKHSHKPLSLVVACDMPFLNTDFLANMVEVAIVADSQITVAESIEYGYETLCAVYHRDLLPLVEEMIVKRELKLTDIYSRVKLRTLSADECRPYNKYGILFSNVNTVDDFEIARRRLEAMAHSA